MIHSDDLDLFKKATSDVRRLPKHDDHVSTRANTPLHITFRQDPDDRLRHEIRPETVSASARQVDGKTARKIKQGKVAIDGTLDLHGLTLDRARAALRHFVADAHAAGQRCVLVITGKGEVGVGTPDQPAKGAIRRALPTWISEKPLDFMVLRLDTAASHHGGTGAFYLYLRRIRDKS